MPSEAAAWCGGVLGAACTGESRCSGRGFLRGIVGLCGGSARHVERAVAGVFSVRARATRRVRRVSGGSGVMLWPVAPRRGSCFPCAWWRMMLMLGGVVHGSRWYGPGDPRAVPRRRGFVFREQHAHAQRPIRKRKRSRKCGTVFSLNASNHEDLGSREPERRAERGTGVSRGVRRGDVHDPFTCPPV